MQEHIFERMARERNISVEEMRAIISDRIEKGWNDKDPVKREQWRKIPCAGDIPTPDEWLRYAIGTNRHLRENSLALWLLMDIVLTSCPARRGAACKSNQARQRLCG